MENMYRAPKSSLGRSASTQGLSDGLIQALGSASIWARFTSVINFIMLFFVAAYVLLMMLGVVGVSKMPEMQNAGYAKGFFIGIIIVMLPSIVIYWFYGSSMNRYAKAAKALREGDESEEHVAQCFAASSTFLKTTAWVLIIVSVLMLLGIMAAIVLPAYQDYVMRARG